MKSLGYNSSFQNFPHFAIINMSNTVHKVHDAHSFFNEWVQRTD